MIASLSSFICRLPFTEEGKARKEQRISLMHCCIRYLLKVDSASTFERAVRDRTTLTYEEARETRLQLTGSAYFVQTLKGWALLHVYKPPDNETMALARARRYGVRSADAKTLWTHIQELWEGSALNDLYELLWSSPGARVAMHPEQARTALGPIYQDLYKHTKRLVWRKMRFIMNSNNEEVDDLVSKLIVQAVARFWWMLPTAKTPLHITNSLRAAVNGLAVNDIQWYTAKCRSRLNSDGVGGYTLQTVSQNQIGADVQYHELADQATLTVNTTAPSDNKMMVVQLHNHVAAGPNARARLKLLMLLTGEHNKAFSKYLTERGLPENDEFCDTHDPDSYLEHAAQFTGIKRPKTFLTDLKRLFG